MNQSIAHAPLYNLDAEQNLIGGLLYDPRAYWKVRERIDTDDFYDGLHQRMFNAFERLVGESEDPNLIFQKMIREFADVEGLGPCGFREYAAQLIADCSVGASFPLYADVVRQLRIKRRMADAGDRITRKAKEPDIESATVVEFAQDEIAAATKVSGTQSTFISIGEAARRVMERLGEPKRGVPSGLEALDECLGGFQAGASYILAARPGMGKTSAGLSVALNAAKAGSGVAFFSLEMPTGQLLPRAFSDLLYDRQRTPYNRILKSELDAQEEVLVRDVAASLGDLPIIFDDASGKSISDLRLSAKRCAQLLNRPTRRVVDLEGKSLSVGPGLGLIVIDYLGLIRPCSEYRGNKVAETGAISAGLKALAKEMNVPVIALAQLSRQVETRDDKRPQLADLRWSGDIEQDADAVIFLYRPEYYFGESPDDIDERMEWDARRRKVENKLHLIVAKNRHGPLADLEFHCDIACSAIRPKDWGRDQ